MRYIYTVITPEGREFVFGCYANEKSAEREFKKHYAPDWRGLSSGVLQQRAVRDGENLKRGTEWTSELADLY